jgi:hypothetical protein
LKVDGVAHFCSRLISSYLNDFPKASREGDEEKAGGVA